MQKHTFVPEETPDVESGVVIVGLALRQAERIQVEPPRRLDRIGAQQLSAAFAHNGGGAGTLHSVRFNLGLIFWVEFEKVWMQCGYRERNLTRFESLLR